MKLTYAEQYRHPQWQRRRLERMEASGFACEECEATEITLNVHHKRYVKGRMVWEYEDAELEVLCEPCHEKVHNARNRLAEIVSELSSFDLEVLVGYAQGLRLIATSYAFEPAIYKLERYEQIAGIADASHVSREALDELLGNDVEITGRFLQDLALAEAAKKGPDA